MSDDGRDRFEIPKDMRAMAEASFEQARKTFEKFVASAQAAAGTIEERNAAAPAGAKEIGARRSPMPKRTCRPRSTTRSRC